MTLIPHRLICRAVLLLVVLAAVQAAPAAPVPGFTGEVDVTLRHAMVTDPANADSAGNLFLHLAADNGTWARVWGKGYTISEHMGVVRSAQVTPEAVTLTIDMLILGDFWVKGEWPASFEITLQRRPDGRLSGSYTGSFQGNALRGAAEGQLFPPRKRLRDIQPPAVDEHPRVLFRKSDIPSLKEKLKTPLGQAYLARASEGDPINLGVLYQLTGDKAYADKARQIIEGQYKKSGDGIPVYGFGSGGFGHEIFNVAIAYDLCVDAWPSMFNAWIRQQLEDFTERQQLVLMTSHANFHPCSNYYGPGRGVPGVVSMILWGDKGPQPREPRSPLDKSWTVKPPEGLKPGKDVPTVKLAAGQMPDRWIWTGSLPLKSSNDVLGKIGGYAGANPGVGTRATYVTAAGNWVKEAELEFAALPAEAFADGGIQLGKLAADGGELLAAFYTTFQFAKQETVRVDPGRDDVRVFISGVEIKPDTFYEVQPGLHSMLVEVRTKKAEGAVRAPLVEVNPQGDSEPMQLYRMHKALYEQDLAIWKANQMNPVRQFWLDRGWFQNYQHWLWGVGDGGFKAETGGYANISSWYPSVYATACRNFWGIAPSPRPDVSMIMPRQIMQAVFPAGGGVEITKLNSALSLDTRWMANAFPVIPERFQPSALWVWNRLAGVTGPDTVTRLIAGDARGKNAPTGFSLAQTFINYPLDLEPVHPSKGMPNTWSAETFGFYVFRSGFAGGDDFVAQIFAKAAPVQGWNHPNAAAFTLRGLGREWTNAPESRNGARELYSVVLLEDDDINQSSSGRIIHHETRPDGSGSLTIDMGDVYAAPSKGLYDGMFNRDPDRLKPSGITGLRAFGFDYSGASGAPALVVLVDKIDGGGRKTWTWQRGGGEVRIDGNSFTIAGDGATMKGTFITPEAVKIEAPGPEEIKIGDPRHGYHGTVNRIKATGGDNFFVVLTFQKGDAPKVQVEGKGLDAVVKVGGQTVRFDGKNVVFGK